jgi:hypothetical protein
MKTILTILALVLISISSTSCALHADEELVGPPPPDPIEVLEAQVEQERQERLEAEELATIEAESRRRWELATIGLGVLGLLGFFAGTLLGSYGRRHASLPS